MDRRDAACSSSPGSLSIPSQGRQGPLLPRALPTFLLSEESRFLSLVHGQNLPATSMDLNTGESERTTGFSAALF